MKKTNWNTIDLSKQKWSKNILLVIFFCVFHGDLHTYARDELNKAIWKGNIKRVKLLIDAGARINGFRTKDHEGCMEYYAPLHMAASRGNAKIVKLLIDAGANVNVQTHTDGFDKMTALCIAARRGYFMVAKLLIDAGADISIKAYWGQTAIKFAKKNGSINIVKLIHNVSKQLLQSARSGNLAQMQKLIERGVDKDTSSDTYHWTSLHLAAQYNHKKIVQFLIDNQANLNARDIKMHTPLHSAANHGHTEICKMLLKCNAKLNAKDIDKRSPLYWAINGSAKNESTIKLLCFEEVKAGSLKAAQATVNRQLNLNEQDSVYGKTLLHFCTEQRHKKVVAYLLQQTSINCDLQDKNLNTPLISAVKTKQYSIAKILISANADPDIQDKNKKSALHYAVEYGNKKFIDYLLKAGASFGLRDRDGKTPGFWAQGSKKLNLLIHGNENKPQFRDVIGLHTVLAQIKAEIELLKNTEQNETEIIAPRALLLYGPRGTGKTLSARATAQETDCTFVELTNRSISGIKSAYNKARKKRPAVLFIDEIDEVAGKGIAETEQLITMMQKKPTDRVLIIGTTNWLSKLDDRLLNSFATNQQIPVPLPSEQSRKIMIDLFMSKRISQTRVNADFITLLAKRTRGRSGRDLREIVNQAHAIAFKRAQTFRSNCLVHQKDFWQVLNNQTDAAKIFRQYLQTILPDIAALIDPFTIAGFSQQFKNISEQNIELLVKKIGYRFEKNIFEKNGESISTSTQAEIYFANYFEMALKEIILNLPTAPESDETKNDQMPPNAPEIVESKTLVSTAPTLILSELDNPKTDMNVMEQVFESKIDNEMPTAPESLTSTQYEILKQLIETHLTLDASINDAFIAQVAQRAQQRSYNLKVLIEEVKKRTQAKQDKATSSSTLITKRIHFEQTLQSLGNNKLSPS